LLVFIHCLIKYLTMELLENIIGLLLFILVIAGMWRIFEKAGKQGWKAIIPIYNLYIILKIVGKPWWWIILMMIPFIGFIWTVWSNNLLAKSFGKGVGYTLGLVILPIIFYPLLGFSDARYKGVPGESPSFE
jgi:hypothetical protein